jgi:hypothetical protein
MAIRGPELVQGLGSQPKGAPRRPAALTHTPLPVGWASHIGKGKGMLPVLSGDIPLGQSCVCPRQRSRPPRSAREQRGSASIGHSKPAFRDYSKLQAASA